MDECLTNRTPMCRVLAFNQVECAGNDDVVHLDSDVSVTFDEEKQRSGVLLPTCLDELRDDVRPDVGRPMSVGHEVVVEMGETAAVVEDRVRRRCVEMPCERAEAQVLPTSRPHDGGWRVTVDRM